MSLSLRPRSLALCVVALPLLMAVSACDTAAEPVAEPSGAAATEASGPRVIDTPDCAPDGARAVVAGTQDDPAIVVTLGEGAQGIVFAPQSGADYCQWADELARYAGEGYRVASFAWSGDGAATLEAAVDVLRGEGAEDVVLVGSSKGGGFVAGVADDLEPAPVGVIALSPGVEVEGVDATSANSSYTGPLLVIASEADGSIRASESREVARADDPATYVEVPGGAHGVAIFATDAGPQIIEQIDLFIAAAFGS